MKRFFLLTFMKFISLLPIHAQKTLSSNSFYDLKAKSIDGVEISMDAYRGKVVLVVNTASKCGFTPQFEGLQNLYASYAEHDFVVLGFPCNQFANQEFGNITEIKNFCSLNYDVQFPMFEKVDVNGKSAHPIFIYLKKELTGNFGNDIKWNFTKFLIDASGKPYKRYAPTTKPEDIALDIEKLLGFIH
jgi:glutathione peroxidase